MPADTSTRCRLVGQRLHDARLAHGVSLQAMAETLGRGMRDVERWETGRTLVSMATLLEWAHALDCDLVLQPRGHQQPGSPPTSVPVDIRLTRAFAAADTRTRSAVELLLGMDRPVPAEVSLMLRPGRRATGMREVQLMLTPEQRQTLLRSDMPFTGNKLLLALKLTGATITQLAHAAALRYSRVANLVGGRVKHVPFGCAEALATCMGCAATDLFPSSMLEGSSPETAACVTHAADPAALSA